MLFNSCDAKAILKNPFFDPDHGFTCSTGCCCHLNTAGSEAGCIFARLSLEAITGHISPPQHWEHRTAPGSLAFVSRDTQACFVINRGHFTVSSLDPVLS